MCIVFLIIPGPDTAITTKNTITVGKVGGLKTVLGTCCALLIHTSAAVLGLSAIIMKTALLFSVIKYVGAVYLIYLGVKTLMSLKKKGETTNNDEMNINREFVNTSCFKQGFLTIILNPKTAVLFLSFFPQFVDSSSNSFIPFLIMGATYTIMTALWSVLFVQLLNQISVFMKKPKTQKVIEGVLGTVLIGFGIRLFFEKAHH